MTAMQNCCFSILASHWWIESLPPHRMASSLQRTKGLPLPVSRITFPQFQVDLKGDCNFLLPRCVSLGAMHPNSTLKTCLKCAS